MNGRLYSAAKRDLIHDWAGKWLELIKLINEVTGTDEPPWSSLFPAEMYEIRVARMTKAAHAEGNDKLVKPIEERGKLVLTCMKAKNYNRFNKDVVKWVGEVTSLDDLNRWLGLAMNIWNATPQPDRGGKAAYELSREELLLDD